MTWGYTPARENVSALSCAFFTRQYLLGQGGPAQDCSDFTLSYRPAPKPSRHDHRRLQDFAQSFIYTFCSDLWPRFVWNNCAAILVSLFPFFRTCRNSLYVRSLLTTSQKKGERTETGNNPHQKISRGSATRSRLNHAQMIAKRVLKNCFQFPRIAFY